MKVEFLGTGGAITTPQPGCDCQICVAAREKGVPYSRTGPSTFVHGPDVLIDTPEEIKYQLDRSTVQRVTGCFYSHWHPDHVMGRRVWEMNKDWRGWPGRNACTDIYVPQGVASDFRERLGTWEHLTFFERRGLVRLIEVPDGDSVRIDKTEITPLRLAESYAYAFLFQEGEKRLLLVPDELRGWDPPASVRGVDLAVLPMGVVEFDPFSGERRIHESHSVLRSEATFRQTLDIVRELEARHVVLAHIEEPDGLGYDDLLRLASRLQETGLDIAFAFDTLILEV